MEVIHSRRHVRTSWSRPTLDGTRKLRCCRQHALVVATWFAAVSTATVVSHEGTYASTPLTTAAAIPTPQLPGGGSTLFPGRLLVAIYGHPGDENLGVLGEQPVDVAVQRARYIAGQYTGIKLRSRWSRRSRSSPPSPRPRPALTATTRRKARSTTSGHGSTRLPRAGLYVVLDLQPGHTDFLTQAIRYEALLAQPHVGLALDPEWRLAL